MILFIIAFIVLVLPILLKRQKQRQRVDDVLQDVSYWKREVEMMEREKGESDLDDEKLTLAKNRLSFAKKAYRVKMKR